MNRANIGVCHAYVMYLFMLLNSGSYQPQKCNSSHTEDATHDYKFVQIILANEEGGKDKSTLVIIKMNFEHILCILLRQTYPMVLTSDIK